MTDRDKKDGPRCPIPDGGISGPGAAVAGVTPLPTGVDPNRRVRVRTWRADPPERPPWSRPRRSWWGALRSSIRLYFFLVSRR